MSSAFRFPSGHALRRALLTAAALSLPACDASRPVGQGGVRQVAILLDGDTLRPGQPRLARAVATGRDGEVLDAAVTWRSLTPTTLAVGPTGQLVGLATGTGVVRAAVGRITKERVVYLVNPPAVGFIVDPDTLRLQVPGVGTVPSVIPLDINGAPFNPIAPFGGTKQSGRGRELGRWGLDEYLEPKALQIGAEAVPFVLP